MNENTFTSERSHVRVDFSPLSTSCNLVCITPQSPCAQTVTTLGGTAEYEPDRQLTPTVIFPDVRATDPDNIFTHGSVNKYLSIDEMEWLVDGKPISKVWTAKSGSILNDYEIDTSDSDTRGSLKVYKNLPASERRVLSFKGKFLDWRTGIVYYVESDNKPLSCVDKGADIIKCTVDKPNIVYDPLYDNLLLYDYKKARGIATEGKRDDYVDGKCYEQVENVLLTIGTAEQKTLPDGYTMRVVKLGTDKALTPNSTKSPELLSATFPIVKFDMRMIDKGEYEVQIMKSGAVISRDTIGLTTHVTMPSMATVLRQADINPSMDQYTNFGLVSLANRTVEYPELYYLIQWLTQAKVYDGSTWKYATEKKWQRGMNMSAPISDLGIGMTQNNSFFDIWFKIDPHHTQQLLTDEKGNVLTDEKGNVLIG